MCDNCVHVKQVGHESKSPQITRRHFTVAVTQKENVYILIQDEFHLENTSLPVSVPWTSLSDLSQLSPRGETHPETTF